MINVRLEMAHPFTWYRISGGLRLHGKRFSPLSLAFIGYNLIGRKFSVDCSRFGQKIGDAGCLPCMVVVKKIVSLHKLVILKISQGLIQRDPAQIDCFEYCRCKCLASCWSDSMVFSKLMKEFVWHFRRFSWKTMVSMCLLIALRICMIFLQLVPT